MCGRDVLKATLQDLKEMYGAVPEGTFEFQPVYNVAPTFDMPIVRTSDDGERTIELYRWGLVPFWAGDVSTGYSMINARSESLSQKKSFSRPFKSQRQISRYPNCMTGCQRLISGATTPEF